MYYSRLLIPTLREVPSEAESISHILMLRAGYVRQLAAGLYIFLPLAWRVMNKINRIIREEMDAIGAQELSMPVLHPAEVWQQTGRWFDIGSEMFRLKDRTDRDMCLAMTHEEIMTWLASKEIRSYRDLPQIWYQIQTKMRDEARPKSGVLRTREFIMKDSYSFDIDDEGLQKTYDLHIEAYNRIFSRCGLRFYMVESDPGMMGGNVSHEFMAPSPAGEDEIVRCEGCGYTANIEVARSEPIIYPELQCSYEEVYTPNQRTVAEVSQFLQIEPHYFIKSLLYISDKKPVLALIRGDQELNEKKLAKILGNVVRPAHKEEVLSILNVEAGFIGPMGHSVRIIADEGLKSGVYVTGANKSEHHVKGIVPQKDFDAEYHDIHTAKSGDRCVKCGHILISERVIEVGNIFKLGTRYSEPLNARYLSQDGIEKPIVMGSYGIGPARIAASAIEQNNDKDGIIWPKSIAPFMLHIIPLNLKDEKTREVMQSVYNGLIQKGFEVLLDDRDERPGVKFKDADLIGIPYQLVIGEKSLKSGYIELKSRRTKEVTKIGLE
ncbi:MAG: proline--tRNA ligase, partial [Thermodesulfovibrionales bacterium]|nr:proline--tRNA ligase [Thermodesulfovibrionales bacterium]